MFVEELGQGTTTNVYGFYSLTLNQGSYKVKYSYVDIRIFEDAILNTNVRKNIDLSESDDLLQEVVVEAEQSDENTRILQMGKIDLNIDKIKTIPAFMGEVDVLKTIQFYLVFSLVGRKYWILCKRRWTDQNLILLDEATVYNASHLFGFFSVFNADAIKNVSLTKRRNACKLWR